mgnify:CR=1 FL=1
MNKKDIISLIAYRMHLATSLIKYEVRNNASTSTLTLSNNHSVNSETSEDEAEPPRKKQRKVVSQPILEVRYDNVGHLPVYSADNFASKCRFPGCKSRSRVKCVKCNMYLCILKNNWFLKYHTR